MRTTSLGLSIFGSATALARRLGRELQTFGIMLIRRLWRNMQLLKKDIRPNCLQDVLLEQWFAIVL